MKKEGALLCTSCRAKQTWVFLGAFSHDWRNLFCKVLLAAVLLTILHYLFVRNNWPFLYLLVGVPKANFVELLYLGQNELRLFLW